MKKRSDISYLEVDATLKKYKLESSTHSEDGASVVMAQDLTIFKEEIDELKRRLQSIHDLTEKVL
jgi:hypothetical protein